MYYTGIDFHRKTSYLTTINDRGEVVKRGNLRNDKEAILVYFSELAEPSRVVIEATGGCFWLHDLLVENGIEVVVCDPAKTKAISSSKIKNDKLDSHMLAQLLRANLVAQVYVVSLQARMLKERIRHREYLVRDMRRIKNRVHSILIKNNLHCPYKDIMGVKGRRYLQQLDLPSYHREQLDTYLHLYDQLKDRVDPIEKELRVIAREHPICELLMTIPGVGPIVALMLVAVIDDIHRFPSFRHLSSYVGVVPSVRASGSKVRRGHITRCGCSLLRWLLVQAANSVAGSRANKLNVYFRRMAVRGGVRKAKVATAHKILQVVYYVWKNQTPYQECYGAKA